MAHGVWAKLVMYCFYQALQIDKESLINRKGLLRQGCRGVTSRGNRRWPLELELKIKA